MTYKFDKFHGSDDYIADEMIQRIVNAAIALERPLLVRGEPGTGKTLLAHSIADALNKKLIIWNIKSTTKASDGLYVYDQVMRLNDARFGDRDISDIRQYIKLGKLGEAFASEEQVVLLIDEIDKADIEFPNDLLNELDEMSFYINETGDEIKAKTRPIVVITSNAEKELPDAFLRRCVFHYIDFPEKKLMRDIVKVHHPNIQDKLLEQVLDKFYHLRSLNYLRKKPSTSELIDWIAILIKAGMSEKKIEEKIPFIGSLIKKEQDMDEYQRKKTVTQQPGRSYYY